MPKPARAVLVDVQAHAGGVECPACHHPQCDVVDSRPRRGSIRRRRVCQACQTRFSTYEVIGDPEVFEAQRVRAQAIAAQLRAIAARLEAWTDDGGMIDAPR